MKSMQKGLILITGVPASGKSYLAQIINHALNVVSVNTKIFSTDNLQALMAFNISTLPDEIKKILSQQTWSQVLQNFKLNKQQFDEKIWNLSRKMIENEEVLEILLKNCQILIIQDELPLKSQRKPFRKYCSDHKIKFLEIHVRTTLDKALQNNNKRGIQNESSKVSEEVIKKSFEKFETNRDSLIFQMNSIQGFSVPQILSHMKYVQIQDNYSQYLAKKEIIYESNEKQLDEMQIRKFITKLIKDDNQAKQYFDSPLSTKQRAQILSQCKKLYIQNHRKKSFKQIINQFMLKKI